MDITKQLMICEGPQLKEVSWEDVLSEEIKKQYFLDLASFVKLSRKSKKVFPSSDNLLKAFELVDFSKIKIVILGQDPYHGENQANGLAFSVPEGQKIPPSLRNIFKEISTDLGVEMNIKNGDLTYLAKQGILLLNSILTVEENAPASHVNKGWETFTDFILNQISLRKEGVVFMLWGKFAQSKKNLIDESKHLVLCTSHPSPYSANSGFFGCKHFSKANQYLKVGINWSNK